MKGFGITTSKVMAYRRLFISTYFRIALFFLITIPYLGTRTNEVYQVSGQAWFFGFNIGKLSLNFPGFSTNIPRIFQSIDSPLNFVYYVALLSTIWGLSFYLAERILKYFSNSFISFLLSTGFHVNPYIITVFMSAPFWDFFPKILLFEYLLLCILARLKIKFELQRPTLFSQHINFYSSWIILLVGLFSISIRYSSLNLILFFLLIVFLYFDKFGLKSLYFFISAVSLFFIFLLNIMPGNLIQLKAYFISSIYHSNYASLMHFTRPLSFPLVDDGILNYLAQTSLKQLLLDKFYYTHMVDVIKMYFSLMAQNSPIYNLFPNSGLLIYSSYISILTILIFLISIRARCQYSAMIIRVFLLILMWTFLLSFISRPQFNQDAYLLFFEYCFLAILAKYFLKQVISVRRNG